MIVGLGNPGTKYARNRHNVGFRAVDLVAARHGLGELRAGGKLGAATATGVITTPRGRQKVVLLQPMEFMNLSGFALQRADPVLIGRRHVLRSYLRRQILDFDLRRRRHHRQPVAQIFQLPHVAGKIQ